MEFFAITIRGLEGLCAEEMAELPGLIVRETGYRRVTAGYDGPPADLLALRTVDDVYLTLATWTGILRQRDTLAHIREDSGRLKLLRGGDVLAHLRTLPERPSFSVTASFVGKRNYSADEIKLAVAEGVTGRVGWPYSENDQPGVLNLRVFIEHEQAWVGLRLADHPMHQRPYKQANIPGSTKPTVAAAMARLAEIPAGGVVLDPCCGAGTVLIEAGLTRGGAGATLRGGDSDADAVTACQENLARAGLTADARLWDARHLPLADHSVARIVSNLPWGRQVEAERGSDTSLEAFYQALGAELARVLAPGGRMVVLLNDPQALPVPGLTLKNQVQISLFGQNPSILIFEG